MPNVLGPIDRDTWRLMIDLKKTLKEDAGKEEYEIATRKNTAMLKSILEKIAA